MPVIHAGAVRHVTVGEEGRSALKDAAGNPLEERVRVRPELRRPLRRLTTATASSAAPTWAEFTRRSTAAYDIFADLNGDGTIDINDVQIARSRIGAKLS